VSIHFTLAICFSIFFVTKSSIVSGLAPGKAVEITAIQISTSGEDSKGKPLSHKNHATNITIIISQVNLVLSMKKAIQESLSFSSNSSFSR
jgi:hypothetical protein